MFTNRDDAFEALEIAVRGMNIPKFRTQDQKWLGKNLGTYNKEHANYEKAMEIIKFILKKGWN